LLAAESLKTAGMTLEQDNSLPFIPAALSYLGLMSKHGNPDFKRALGGGKPYNFLEEIGRNLIGKGRISPRVLWFTRGIDIAGLAATAQKLDSYETLEALRQEFLNKMGEGGVILCPLLLTPPQRHGWTWFLSTQPPYTLMFNALGFPAVVLPIRYNEKGLPLVVQIVARPNEDEVALAVAQELENRHAGWKLANP
jgi:Asp-tRNA(Asn)/Glu-tRNA(Gln) amidotransferase A subunit family amidase